MVQVSFVTALTLVSALALALVYGLGGWFALHGRLDPGAVVALALLLTRLYAPLTALAGARVEVMSALVSFERVFEVLDLEPLIKEKPDAREVPDGPVSVEFDRVDFGYPAADKVSLASLEEVATLDTRGGVEVLHQLSFRAEPGQMVALVGSSGAGKSTIAQLLPRLYDADGGAVRLSGVDVRDLTADSIRATLGMVTQDGHLFHDSIRANLLLARPEATDEELWEVLRRARLEGLIASLPDGLETVVGERGYRLSGGERQRLTIARLLLARPRVVILDEATAHLDSTSEADVQEALGEALEGRTAVVIAHRLSTVRAADLILVVEDGRIVERGTHTALLAAGGRYEELYRTQFEQPDATGDGCAVDGASATGMAAKVAAVDGASATGMAGVDGATLDGGPTAAGPRRRRLVPSSPIRPPEHISRDRPAPSSPSPRPEPARQAVPPPAEGPRADPRLRGAAGGRRTGRVRQPRSPAPAAQGAGERGGRRAAVRRPGRGARHRAGLRHPAPSGHLRRDHRRMRGPPAARGGSARARRAEPRRPSAAGDPYPHPRRRLGERRAGPGGARRRTGQVRERRAAQDRRP
ncbi:hypothetical protein GCM10017744_023630 [Streptomyces antimycoticus]